MRSALDENAPITDDTGQNIPFGRDALRDPNLALALDALQPQPANPEQIFFVIRPA